MNALLDKQGKVQDRLDAAGAWDLDSRLGAGDGRLRCPPGDTPVKVLSGGEMRRVALCRLLLQKPDILLLDEPTNHLDAESVAWLEQHLQQYEGTVIAVTHDRYFLDNVAGWILELDRGHGHPVEGELLVLAGTEAGAAPARGEGGRPSGSARSSASWNGSACRPRARHAKGKARISAYETLLQQEQRASWRGTWRSSSRPGRGLGDVVIDAAGVAKSYGDRLLFEDMTFTSRPGRSWGSSGQTGRARPRCFA